MGEDVKNKRDKIKKMYDELSDKQKDALLEEVQQGKERYEKLMEEWREKYGVTEEDEKVKRKKSKKKKDYEDETKPEKSKGEKKKKEEEKEEKVEKVEKAQKKKGKQKEKEQTQ